MTPQTTSPGSASGTPWLLLACTLVLAACGYLLLNHGQGQATQPSTTDAARPAPGTPSKTAAPLSEPATPGTPHPPASHSPAPTPSDAIAPPRSEGRAADAPIQRLLEQAWPADLPAAQEQQLRRDGALLLRADTTGVGRERFPQVFGDRPTQQVAPAFSRLRIQAAIARKDGRGGDRAVVHLVWAAADRGGTYTDGHISDLYFHRPKGHGPWTALPRP